MLWRIKLEYDTANLFRHYETASSRAGSAGPVGQCTTNTVFGAYRTGWRSLKSTELPSRMPGCL
jgi:hypothetical protein